MASSWPFPFFVKGNGRAVSFWPRVGWTFKKIYSHLGVVVMMNAVCRTFTIGRFLAPSWPFPFFVKGNGRAVSFWPRAGWTFKKIYSHLGVVVMMNAVCRTFTIGRFLAPSWPFPFFVKGNGRAVSFWPRVGWTFKKIYSHLGVVVMMNAVCRTFTIGRFLASSWPFPFFVKGNGRAFRFGQGRSHVALLQLQCLIIILDYIYIYIYIYIYLARLQLFEYSVLLLA